MVYLKLGFHLTMVSPKIMYMEPRLVGTTFYKYVRRHTAAELLESANHENIDVLIHATVQKVEQSYEFTLVPFKTPMEQSLVQTVGITKAGVYIEATSGFSQSPDSIRCDHGMSKHVFFTFYIQTAHEVSKNISHNQSLVL
ncbi:hypothetical protein POM88_051656 [Heracleum sosnowskyi]|uniref:Uncharacterized protein n=1 Tax=Heracleum sosnowskyi TaxID=360622 RepID=A0AAD8H003_9APIA|nr:hypothetical protein POM88_051656 [Heracleum sosnowskyi]